MKRIFLLCGFSFLGLFFCNVAAASDRYFLNAGDLLEVSVWNEETLEKTVIVLPDGMISFPLAGVLRAEGKTVTELQEVLKKELSEYLSDPVVTVSVVEVRGNTVHILGKVIRPGNFIMNKSLDVMQALSLAGGFSPYAKENDIIVLRRQGDVRRVYKVRYADIKEGDDLSSNIMLKSGDTIVIP